MIAALGVLSVACLCGGVFSTVKFTGASATETVPATEATEIAFSETKLNVSNTGDKMLIVTAINNAELIENVSEIGYMIDGYTVTDSDLAETDKYYSTITLGDGEAKSAQKLGFTGATESSKLLVWEVAYSADVNYDITAYATVWNNGEAKTVYGTKKTNTFKVTYVSGDETVATQDVNYNGTADLDAVNEYLVAQDGYTCAWKTESGAEFTAETVIKGNVTVNVTYTGIKLEKQEAEAATVYNLVGETLAMPTDVEAAASNFYKNEYTLTWTFGDREVSGDTIALTAEDMGTETEGKQSLLVCTAAKTADGSDEHVVYEKSYTVYKIREEQLEPIYVTATGNLGDGTYHILFGSHDNATDGELVSAIMDGSTVMYPLVGGQKISVHANGQYYSQTGYYENGSHDLVVRSEKKIVYQTINRADVFVTNLTDFKWYQANRSGLYIGFSQDVTFDSNIVSNKVTSAWAGTFCQAVVNSLDGFGHSINAIYTNDMHWGKITYASSNYSPFTGIFENVNSGVTIKNVRFNLDITLPFANSRVFGNLNEGATVENCVFNINANNNIYKGVGSTEDWNGKPLQWGEAIFGTCAGTVKDSLFINTGLNNYRFALNSAAHVENCVVVNVSSTGSVNDNNGVAQLFFPVTTNENTKFWLYDTLANAISGTFANVSGYATATADGAATFVQENAKPLAEIFASSAYLTVKDGAAYWNGKAL